MEKEQKKPEKENLKELLKPLALMNKKTGQQFIIGFVDAIHGKGAKSFT